MKHTFTALACALLASFAAAAAPRAATEAWVRNYVSTNSAGGGSTYRTTSTTVSDTMTIDGTNVTLALTINTSSCPSWRIVESSVTGMPVGVNFAVDSYGNACNYTNAACTTLYQSISQNWQRVIRSVSGGVTNVTTNAICVTRLDFTVNGVPFMGFEDPRDKTVYAAGVTNVTGIVALKRSYVTPKVKTLITTPPVSARSFSLFEILFPSAYAAWEAGEWEMRGDISPNPEEITADDGTVTAYYYWERHYYWDGSGGTVEVPTLTATFSGGSTYKTFDVDFSKEIVAAGTDYCNLGDISGFLTGSAVDSIKQGVYKAALAALADDAKMTVVFTRFMNAEHFNDAIEEAIKAALDEVYGTGVTCPEYNTTTTVTKPKQDDDDVKPPTPPGPCAHLNAVCRSTANSCNWVCTRCGETVHSGAHDYEDTTAHCSVCRYKYNENSSKCGFASPNEDDHYFDAGLGGNQSGCYCRRHGLWPHPGFGSPSGWKNNETLHWKEKTCTRCATAVKFDSAAHHLQRSVPIYVNQGSCVISNICYECGYSEFAETCGHVMGTLIHAKFDEENHTTGYFCPKCAHMIYLGENPHVPNGMPATYSDAGDEGHRVILTCKAGTNGCGSAYIAGTAPHHPGGAAAGYETHPVSNSYHYVLRSCTNCSHVCKTGPERCSAASVSGSTSGARKIVLVDDVNAKDYFACQYCPAGHAAEVPHNWIFNTDEHWCKQDAADEEHLRGTHRMVNNRCSVCGYSPTLTDDYEGKFVCNKVECKDDCCASGCAVYQRLWRTNGVEIAESERGEWNFVGWDSSNPGYTSCHYCYEDKCICPYCSGSSGSLLYSDCYCPHITNGELISFCDPIVSASYHLRYAGSSAKLVDFSDPVYEVGDSCFLEAFVSMPNLTFVNASTITNVGYQAFAYAFTNDTLLATVLFDSLRTADACAFKGAFVKCPLNNGVTFSQLKECGSGCFDGAFKETSVESLEFPALCDTSGALDLFGGTVCASLKSLSVPKLEVEYSYETFDFDDMPNLETINLSGASTNAVRKIGDMSKLSKLTRLDYSKMLGVPDFYGTDGHTHAPTNASDCLIVVPNDLCTAWRAAPGWHDLRRQIVPYSNQVMQTSVIVSFETGYGDFVTPVSVLKGDTLDAPTNIHCYATSLGGYDGGISFAGWYYDSALTDAYEATDTFHENTCLYAKWQNNCYINAEDVILHDLFYEQGKTYFQGIYVTDFKTGFMDYFHGALDKDNFKVYCVYNNTTNAVPVTSIVYQAGKFEFNFNFGNISAPGQVEHWIQIDCMDESNKTRSESVYTSILSD